MMTVSWKKILESGARRKRIGNERGSTLLFTAVAAVAIFSFAALAIDGAILMTTRTQLHAAADAAALAGASALVHGDKDEAVRRAINFASYNRAYRVRQMPVIISEKDVSFPRPNVIRVKTHRTRAAGDPLRTFFLQIIDPGSNRMSEMTAVAAAEAYDVCGSRCLKPWSIPDRWADVNKNGKFDAGDYYDPETTGYNAPSDVGERIVLKVGNPQETIASGVFYPVDYPPLDNPEGEKPRTGGSWYRTWISECVPFIVNVGDRLLVEPGKMEGPTQQGMRDLVKQDPGAYWDEATQTVQGSAFPQSPRIGLIPFFDPTQPVTPGRDYITVVKLGAFFIERVDKGGDVMGRFIVITTQGPPCPGGVSSSFVRNIALVE